MTVDLAKLDPSLREAIEKAFLMSLNDEAKTVLIKHAMDYLLAPQNQGYGNRPVSPLQSILNQCLTDVARKIIVAEFENPESEIKQKVIGLARQMVERMTTDKVEDKIVKHLGELVNKAVERVDW